MLGLAKDNPTANKTVRPNNFILTLHCAKTDGNPKLSAFKNVTFCALDGQLCAKSLLTLDQLRIPRLRVSIKKSCLSNVDEIIEAQSCVNIVRCPGMNWILSIYIQSTDVHVAAI